MNLQRAFAAFLRTFAAEAAAWSFLRGFNLGPLGPHVGLIVRQFREAGALTPRTARRFYPRSSVEADAFARLLDRFIICQSKPGHYFLNIDALQRLWPGWSSPE